MAINPNKIQVYLQKDIKKALQDYRISRGITNDSQAVNHALGVFFKLQEEKPNDEYVKLNDYRETTRRLENQIDLLHFKYFELIKILKELQSSKTTQDYRETTGRDDETTQDYHETTGRDDETTQDYHETTDGLSNGVCNLTKKDEVEPVIVDEIKDNGLHEEVQEKEMETSPFIKDSILDGYALGDELPKSLVMAHTGSSKNQDLINKRTFRKDNTYPLLDYGIRFEGSDKNIKYFKT